jgi:glutathione S-transferase
MEFGLVPAAAGVAKLAQFAIGDLTGLVGLSRRQQGRRQQITGELNPDLCPGLFHCFDAEANLGFGRVIRTAKSDRDEAAVREALRILANRLNIAEAQLRRHAFLAGDNFTLADIQFGHVLYRYFDITIDRPEHPALQRYYDRLKRRPAFQEHVMVSYEELRAGC